MSADHTPTALTERLLGLLVGQASEHALVLLDTEGRIVAWLAGAEHVFGYRAEEVVGRHAALLFAPEDVAQGVPEFELRSAASSGKAEDDRWMVRKDGVRIWVSGIVNALRDEHGELIGFGKIMRDTTDVRGQLDALSSRVQSLLAADERKNVFMGTLAHELANAFSPLGMALRLARRRAPRGDEDGIERLLSTMERQLELTTRLLDDLREATRIGQGKLLLHKRALELGEAIEHASQVLRPVIEQRRQVYTVILPSAPIVLEADPTRLNEVLVNLVGNASKYTPEGGSIWVKAVPDDDQVVIKVEDTGIGIGPEMLPRIFDLFAQEAPHSEQAQGGLGIGLWLVKNLVDLHGGTISVRSPGRDKGSEFTVRLPCRGAVDPSHPDGGEG